MHTNHLITLQEGDGRAWPAAWPSGVLHPFPCTDHGLIQPLRDTGQAKAHQRPPSLGAWKAWRADHLQVSTYRTIQLISVGKRNGASTGRPRLEPKTTLLCSISSLQLSGTCSARHNLSLLTRSSASGPGSKDCRGKQPGRVSAKRSPQAELRQAAGGQSQSRARLPWAGRFQGPPRNCSLRSWQWLRCSWRPDLMLHSWESLGAPGPGVGQPEHGTSFGLTRGPGEVLSAC